MKKKCECRDFPFELSRLGCNESFALICEGDYLHGVLKGPIEGIGQSCGKCRGQKIDIQLQVALRIEAVHHQSAAAAAGGTHEIEGQSPKRQAIQ